MTERRRSVAPGELAFLAAVIWLPLLSGAHQRVNADTKQYLYLDPGGLLERARSLWDTSVGGGAVTHQMVGYLWPMGPYYWLTDALGVPDWAAQRLWVGGIQLFAALGALVLFRVFFPRPHPAQLVGALGYGLSPFVLGHVTGQSALLLPFAAFGWLVWCVVRGLDERSWRWPAAFALLVTTCGSLNGTSALFVVLGAALWVPFGVLTLGRATVREGVVLLARTAGLTVVCQLWWLVPYAVGGRYGLPILSVTETVAATSSTTSAAEVVRGLGYWFFYGGDVHAPWLEGLAPPYQVAPTILLASFAVPVVALVLAARLRWSARGYFAALATIGLLISTISFAEPWRSPAGVAFDEASQQIDLVLSLRNTQRAAPLVVLGLMGLLAGSLTALSAKRARTALLAAVGFLVAITVAMPAQWRDGLIAERFHREAIPSWWEEAGPALDAEEGNVLELPGIDFASYRWGHTLDPVSVGLTDRPVLARELIPQGGPVGVSLLNALDRSLQEGWYEPEALTPMARLLGASTILVRNDLEYERYRTIRPSRLWSLLTDPASGLTDRTDLGPPTANRAAADQPMLDEIELSLDPRAVPPPPVALFTVPAGDRAALTTHAADAPLLVDGSGEGLLHAAAAGLLDGGGPLLLGADVGRDDTDTALFGTRPRLLVTDSNRKQEERWYTLRENVGATEPVDGGIVERSTPSDGIELVDDAPSAALTTVRWVGADRVWATDYGNEASLAPEDRPSNAFDGDPRTAWRVSTGTASPHAVGIDLGREVTADHVTLVQPQGRPGTQRVLVAVVVLDGTRRFAVEMPDDDDAFDADGFRVDLDGEPFSRLEVELREADTTLGPVGLAEVAIPGVRVDEVVQLPTAVLRAAGEDLGTSPVAIVLARLRADPSEPLRSDPEQRMLRSFELPGPATLAVSGTARLRADADDARVDELIDADGPVTRSSQHLPGDLGARAAAALDGDLTTAWSTPFVGIDDQWWEVDTGEDVELDELLLDLVVDERHSTPSRITLLVDGEDPVRLRVPRLEPGPPGTVREVRLPLPREVEGRTFRITIDAARERETVDWYTNADIELPIALAEVELPGVDPVEPGEEVDTGCRDDLVEVDGEAVEVRITGTPARALARQGLTLEPCDDALELAAGRHELRTTPGATTGLDLDRLVLRTEAWDATPAAAAGPEVRVGSTGRGSASGTVQSDGEPFWLVLDQSANDGWDLEVADADGEHANVDGPHPVDGNAVGWYVRPPGAGPLRVQATWTPQRAVDLALAASIVAVLACLLIVVLHPRRPLRATPRYGPPRLHAGANVAWTRGLAGAAVTTVVAGIFIHPVAALPTGAAMLVFTARPRWGRLIPPALVAAAAVLVIVFQVRDEYAASGAWPSRFGLAHLMVTMAVVLLGMEALTEAGRHRKARLAREERERQRRSPGQPQ